MVSTIILIISLQLIYSLKKVHDLPSNLDAVIISHSHYDHLDLNTVVLLNARYGSDLRWFIPIGLGLFFIRFDSIM